MNIKGEIIYDATITASVFFFFASHYINVSDIISSPPLILDCAISTKRWCLQFKTKFKNIFILLIYSYSLFAILFFPLLFKCFFKSHVKRYINISKTKYFRRKVNFWSKNFKVSSTIVFIWSWMKGHSNWISRSLQKPSWRLSPKKNCPSFQQCSNIIHVQTRRSLKILNELFSRNWKSYLH